MTSNGKPYQRSIFVASHNPVLARILEIILLMGAGMIAMMLHVRFRIPFNLPGHHGIEFMAILLFARLRSNMRFATSLSSLGIGLLLLFPVFGFKDPMAGFNYMLPGIILDVLYTSFPGERKHFIFIGIIAGLSYITIPFSRLLIHLSTGYPYGTFIKFGIWGPLLSFFSFGMIGGLMGFGIEKGLRLLNFKRLFGKTTIVLILAGLMTLVSCKDKEEDYYPPTLQFDDSPSMVCTDTVLSAGDNFTCGVNATGKDLTNFYIRAIVDGQQQTVFDTGIHTSSLQWSRSFVKGLGEEEVWSFTVTDKEGNSDSKTFTITLDTLSNFGPVTSYQDINLGAQNNAAVGGFYSIQDNAVHSLTACDNDPDLQARIDILYYYYGDDKSVIASPGANIEDGVFAGNLDSWTNINTTRYYKTYLTISDFNAITNDSTILANYVEGEGKRKAKKLKVDDIYTFKTNDEKLGIILVKNVNGQDAGDIKFDLKIQQ